MMFEAVLCIDSNYFYFPKPDFDQSRDNPDLSETKRTAGSQNFEGVKAGDKRGTVMNFERTSTIRFPPKTKEWR
jgi:hypothetical protein